MSDVFDEIVGQEPVVERLRAAARAAHAVRPPFAPGTAPARGTEARRPPAPVSGPPAQESRPDAMTHAWLVTGPAGSGRSTAARAFAAALVCRQGGCGTCQSCEDVRHARHDDVAHVVPEGVTYSVDETRELVDLSARLGTRAPWHVFLIEDADRLTEQSANALLKAIEEPTAGTVWLLCAPSTEDVLPTIGSRCRHVQLATPSTEQVAVALAQKFGVDPAMAAFAARAAQGHIGRARALATDEQARLRRADVLRIPTALGSLGDCFVIAGDVVDTARQDAAAICDPLDAQERQQLLAAYGQGGTGKGIGTVERRLKGGLKELERRQKKRRERVVRDHLDRVLTDLMACYRDVLVLQLGSVSPLINDELRPTLQRLAAEGSAEQTLRRTGALERTRSLLEANVSQPLAFESLMVSLKDPSLAP
jgi:DNA polymerase-3 subunit delta'